MGDGLAGDEQRGGEISGAFGAAHSDESLGEPAEVPELTGTELLLETAQWMKSQPTGGDGTSPDKNAGIISEALQLLIKFAS